MKLPVLKKGFLMDNATRYHFSDFTRDNYGRLIQLAKKTYVFRTFQDFKTDERFIIWRHDIDFSVHSSLKLARIEKEENLRGTYLLHLHNPFYNLLEKDVSDHVKEIIKLGHDIGLHFDESYYDDLSLANIEYYLAREKSVLEDFFEKPVPVFSFHSPNKTTLLFEKDRYAGMINAYSEWFRSQVGYCSDSNGYWRVRRLEDVLTKAEDRRLQVLTHPGWWQDEVLSPKQRLEHCIEGRGEHSRQWYLDAIQKAGRDYVDWD